ncbi:MAG: lactate racemase domain-containing protein [Negativicutes bacterium]|nr:lactate racemase domain-containing protein [Negativicutes bacterium]
MEVINNLLKAIPIPKMVRVEQRFPAEDLQDLEGALLTELRKPEIISRVKAGMRIAVGVGSRGMAEIPRIAQVVIKELKRLGAEPFIVPAMGSHGGATAAGQQGVLASLGITEASVGCPILSSMEVADLGVMENGLPVLMDKNACGADGIIVINRVKAHNAFTGPNESGLVKMITIGLGKQKGADSCHTLGFGHMAGFIVEMARIKLEKLPFLFGIGTVENAYDRIAKIAVIPAEEIIVAERELLAQAKANMPKLLLQPIDVLIVDQIGKEFSGGGMDPYTTGRAATPFISVGPDPGKLAVLDITDQSHGNACGMGLADFGTKRLFDKVDFEYTYANNITSTVITGRVPLILASDRLAIQGAVKTSNVLDLSRVRMVRIANSLHIDKIYISENMLEDALRHPDITVLGEPGEMAFDAGGNLTDIGR